MKVSERLVLLLREQGLDMVTEVRRVRRGREAMAAGCWAWSAHTAAGVEVTGSEDTMTECVRNGITLRGSNTGLQVDAYHSGQMWRTP